MLVGNFHHKCRFWMIAPLCTLPARVPRGKPIKPVLKMSAHFTVIDVYDVIVNNDVQGLERTLLLLGQRIRSIQLWRDLTPVEYAARLGHFEQVQVLLEELSRYNSPRGVTDVKFHPYRSVFHELLKHRRTHPEVVLKTVSPDKKWLIETLVEEADFDFLQTHVLRDDESKKEYIDMIVDVVLDWSNDVKLVRTAPAWIKDRENYIEKLQQLRQKHPWKHALKFGDVEQLQPLLGDDLPEELLSEYNEDLFNFVSLTESLLIKCDNEDIQKMATNSANITQLMEMMTIGDLAPFETESQFFRYLLQRALTVERPSMIRVLLSHERFEGISNLRRHQMYFELLLKGKTLSAEMIKEKCVLPVELEESAVKRLCTVVQNSNYRAGSLLEKQRNQCVGDVMAVVEALESFAIDHPDLQRSLEQRLRSFPMESRRPDLVEPFRKFGVDYSLHDVLTHVKYHDQKQSKPIDERMARGLLSDSSEWSKYDSRLYSIKSALSCIFLDHGVADVDIQLAQERVIDALKFRQLIRECVVQSGRKVVLAHPLDTQEKWKTFISELETERRCSLTLLKLCRLAVRAKLSASDNGNSNSLVNDKINSLYSLGQIPVELARYLQYRETDRNEIHLRPIYYSLYDQKRLLPDFGSDPEMNYDSD